MTQSMQPNNLKIEFFTAPQYCTPLFYNAHGTISQTLCTRHDLPHTAAASLESMQEEQYPYSKANAVFTESCSKDYT